MSTANLRNGNVIRYTLPVSSRAWCVCVYIIHTTTTERNVIYIYINLWTLMTCAILVLLYI